MVAFQDGAISCRHNSGGRKGGAGPMVAEHSVNPRQLTRATTTSKPRLLCSGAATVSNSGVDWLEPFPSSTMSRRGVARWEILRAEYELIWSSESQRLGRRLVELRVCMIHQNIAVVVIKKKILVHLLHKSCRHIAIQKTARRAANMTATKMHLTLRGHKTRSHQGMCYNGKSKGI